MILSYHPIYVGDRNITCAGRLPDGRDRDAIREADAVILPQGCSRDLHEMARANCRHVFPNYDARFHYPGKTGQIRLFRRSATPHPATRLFPDLAAFRRRIGKTGRRLDLPFPVVLKFDWGGGGDTVHRVASPEALRRLLETAAAYERTGQYGFLIQECVARPDARVLRVVMVGRRRISYWRVQDDRRQFRVGVSRGAVIETDGDPGLQAAGRSLSRTLCRRTGINLAGLDVIFDRAERPLLLEVNYFFGRRGLGGSRRWYDLLTSEIDAWLASIGLAAPASTGL
jgi:ribosomal protein S6--L-glutamate ligase